MSGDKDSRAKASARSQLSAAAIASYIGLFIVVLTLFAIVSSRGEVFEWVLS